MFAKVGIPVEHNVDKLVSNQLEIVRNGQIDEWRDRLGSDILSMIEADVRSLMERFRYVSCDGRCDQMNETDLGETAHLFALRDRDKR